VCNNENYSNFYGSKGESTKVIVTSVCYQGYRPNPISTRAGRSVMLRFKLSFMHSRLTPPLLTTILIGAGTPPPSPPAQSPPGPLCRPPEPPNCHLAPPCRSGRPLSCQTYDADRLTVAWHTDCSPRRPRKPIMLGPSLGNPLPHGAVLLLAVPRCLSFSS
jgi:hypothetical protein